MSVIMAVKTDVNSSLKNKILFVKPFDAPLTTSLIKSLVIGRVNESLTFVDDEGNGFRYTSGRARKIESDKAREMFRNPRGIDGFKG